MFGKSTLVGLILLATGVSQASELDLEPCVNGGVSATGIWPTEFAEGGLKAGLDWQSYDPYYLFAVSASYRETPFTETPAAPETP
jgi:hypothetical protein